MIPLTALNILAAPFAAFFLRSAHCSLPRVEEAILLAVTTQTDSGLLLSKWWIWNSQRLLTPYWPPLSPPHVGSLAHQQGPPWWIGHPSLSPAQPTSPLHPAGPLSVKPLVVEHWLTQQKKRQAGKHKSHIVFCRSVGVFWGHLQFISGPRERTEMPGRGCSFPFSVNDFIHFLKWVLYHDSVYCHIYCRCRTLIAF